MSLNEDERYTAAAFVAGAKWMQGRCADYLRDKVNHDPLTERCSGNVVGTVLAYSDIIRKWEIQIDVQERANE